MTTRMWYFYALLYACFGLLVPWLRGRPADAPVTLAIVSGFVMIMIAPTLLGERR